jgi:hypothetical protein
MNNPPIEISLISREDVEALFVDEPEMSIRIVEKAFEERTRGQVLLPDKISQVFNEQTQERINCMPATLLEEQVCGV